MTQPQYGPPQPAWGPPPPPKKGMNGCAIAAIIGAAVVGLVIVLGILVAVFASSSGSDSKGSSTPRPASSAPEATPSKQPATEQPAEKAPVTVTAKATAFKPSVLYTSGAYTSVKVTVTNGGKKPISINPLYFTITDTSGSKHTAELGMDENQIATVDLAPGENITGTVTGKGSWKAAYVTYTNGLFGDGVRGTVG